MKRYFFALTLALSASLVSCGSGSSSASAESEQPKGNMEACLDVMRQSTYQMSFSGVQSSHYPLGYEAYDTDTAVSAKRDYGFVDGKADNPRAARVYDGTDVTTYFEAEDGRMYTQIVRENNEVQRSYLASLGTYYRFNKYYYSPFDYISKDDFDENLVLNSTKAYLLFSAYTGLTQPVKSAQFVLNGDNTVAAIDFTFASLPVGYVADSEGNTITVDYDMTGSMEFDYGISPITYLEAYTTKSGIYEDMMANIGSNYTIRATSPSADVDYELYVTEEEVYLHTDASSAAPLVGDMFYRKRNESKYYAFAYTGSSWTRSESVSVDSVLPDFSAISPYLMEDVSLKHLSMKEEACAYGVEHFLLPAMSMTSGTGLKAEIYLEGNDIDYVAMTFAYYSGNINVKNSYLNKGTTELPLWLDASSIQ